LPGSTPAKDFNMFKKLFTSPDFQPDMLKIYPTVVLKDSVLYNMWKKGQYKPPSNKTFEKLVLKIKNEAITPYVRIARLVRDVPTSSIIAGPTISNLRQIIIPESKCPCIRCREVREGYAVKDLPAMLRTEKKNTELKNLTKQNIKTLDDSSIAMQAGKIILDRIDYAASDGQEIFLQYVSPDKKKLFALLRLRITSLTCHSGLDPESSPCSALDPHFHGNDKLYSLLPVLKNAALIREVHTYGKLTQIDKQNSSSPQHIGLGKKLLIEAERIAKEEFGLEKIVVISGVGVRGYYRKSGYKLNQTYMIKNL